jgi:flagellar hook-length control protein FliK
MTTVATITASASSGAAAFTGPARSSDTADQFAIELGKSTQQVREREDSAEPGTKPPQGPADQPAPVENSLGNGSLGNGSLGNESLGIESLGNESLGIESLGDEVAAQQSEQAEPNQLLEIVEVGLVSVEPTELDLDLAPDQQPVLPTPIVVIAAPIIAPADQVVVIDEKAAVVAPAAALPVAISNTEALPTDTADAPAAVPAPQVDSGNVAPANVAPATVAPATVAPATVAPVAVNADTLTSDAVAPVNVTPVNVTPVAVAPVTVPAVNPEAPAAVPATDPTVQLAPSSATPAESASQPPPATTRTPATGEAAPVGTSADAPSSADGPTVQAVANQGGGSQQTPDPSSSSAGEREEPAVVGDLDRQSDQLVQFETSSTARTQGADAAQSIDPRVITSSTIPVATSAPTPVAFESSAPANVVEPKLATPIPVSTQMSAHLSAFRGMADGTYETTIRLNPEELGQVSVRIQVNGGNVSIHAFGASDIAVQALREAMPDLRQDLLRSGLDLVDSQVDQGSASFGDQSEAASGRPLDADKTEAPAENRIGRPTGADLEVTTDAYRSEGGLVDVRV